MMKSLVGDAEQGRPVNLKSWLLNITSNNMTRMLLNKRYFGDEAESKKEKEDFELMIARTFDLIGAFIVSDFVPYLAFVTKLQGWAENHRNFTFEIAGRMLEIEMHREDAKERRGDEGYVPDFVDLLLRTPLGNGKCSH